MVRRVLVACLCFGLAAFPAHAAVTAVHLLTWGTPGDAQGQFFQPFGAAVDSKGNVYVADLLNYRIQKFTSEGVFITSWGRFGEGDGEFNNPTRVAIDQHDFVYVVDLYNNRIQKFTDDGKFILKWGSFGSGNGQLYYPFDVAVGPHENIYVTDQFNHRVQVFTNYGGFLLQWGSLGEGPGQFYYPKGIAVSERGDVYISEIGTHRVQRFTWYGRFLGKWGSPGDRIGEFGQPHGLAVDREERVYVADQWNNRIQVFTNDGGFVTSFGGFGYPFDVGAGSGGRGPDASPHREPVYVADTDGERIRKFALVPSAPGRADGLEAPPLGRHMRALQARRLSADEVVDPIFGRRSGQAEQSGSDVPGSRRSMGVEQPTGSAFETQEVGKGANAANMVLVSPNPGRKRFALTFVTARRGRASMHVFDTQGHRVATILDDESLPPGPHRLDWKWSEDNGSRLPPGIYVIELTVNGARTRAKFVRLP